MSENVTVFTSTTVGLSVNDKPLCLVQSFETEDVVTPEEGRTTYIKIHRHVNGAEDVINEMRTAPFMFKVYNLETNNGYLTYKAEVTSFKMSLQAASGLLKQEIVVRASAFNYTLDVRSSYLVEKEVEDFQNLIEILKKNQEKSRVPSAFLPAEDGTAVTIQDEEVVWTNVNSPEKVVDVVKPRKLKKNKK